MAVQTVTKEVAGIHVLLTRSLFGDGTPRRLLRRVSLVKPTSAALRCLWLPEMKLQSGPRQRPKSRETQRQAGAVRHTTTALQIFRPVLLRLLLPPELRRYDKQGITLQLLALENRALLTLNPLPDSLVFQPQYTRCLRLCYLKRCAPNRGVWILWPEKVPNCAGWKVPSHSMPSVRPLKRHAHSD